MLVLTRKIQEQIRISDDITVTILRIKGSTVRLGIEAPREVRVIRGELPRQSEEQLAADQPASGAAENSSIASGEASAVEPEADGAEQLTEPERKRRAVLQVLRIAEMTHCGA